MGPIWDTATPTGAEGPSQPYPSASRAAPVPPRQSAGRRQSQGDTATKAWRLSGNLRGPHLLPRRMASLPSPHLTASLIAPFPLFVPTLPTLSVPRTWPTPWWSTMRPTCSTGWRRAWRGSSACGTTRGSESGGAGRGKPFGVGEGSDGGAEWPHGCQVTRHGVDQRACTCKGPQVWRGGCGPSQTADRSLAAPARLLRPL